MPRGVYKRTKENNAKLSLALKGRRFTDEQELEIVEKYKSGLSGLDLEEMYQCPLNAIYRVFTRHSIPRRCPGSYRKGKQRSDETKRKLSLAHLGKKKNWKNKLTGSKHHRWKGDKVGYFGLHDWLYKNFGRAKEYPCMFCGVTPDKKRMEWANISGKYKRDLQDWTTLCSPCHHNFDGIAEKMMVTRRKNAKAKLV